MFNSLNEICLTMKEGSSNNYTGVCPGKPHCIVALLIYQNEAALDNP